MGEFISIAEHSESLSETNAALMSCADCRRELVVRSALLVTGVDVDVVGTARRARTAAAGDSAGAHNSSTTNEAHVCSWRRAASAAGGTAA